MNIIDESFEQPTQKKDNSKKIATLILVIIAVLIIAIIGIFIAIVYIKDSTLKLYLNGVQNEKVKEMMVEESDGTIYFPIKEVAAYFGYESFNGEYTDKSEITSKCYIQCDDEIANFALNSNKIYKLQTSNNTANYDYFYAKKPVKAINGKLYASIDAIENTFNVSFTYNKEKQRIYIYTMPYLIESYANKVLDYGYEEISNQYVNQKTVLESMLVVTKNQSKTYAVIDTKGNIIIEPKYDYIEYLPYSGDFLVKSNNKVGIISSNRQTKVQLLYDSLELIDSDAAIYLAKRDNKYGVIDSRGNIKVYIEYDQIGIDSTKFEQNGIKNRYLLDNGMIPARKDKLWGAFNKNGKQILDFKYDSFGYIASINKDAINLLLIPNYNVLVASRNKKYTLINSQGTELCLAVLDDVYMEVSAGNTHYYMNYNNITADVEQFLEQQGVKATSNKSNSNNSSNDNTEDEEEQGNNETDEQNQDENREDENEQDEENNQEDE